MDTPGPPECRVSPGKTLAGSRRKRHQAGRESCLEASLQGGPPFLPFCPGDLHCAVAEGRWPKGMVPRCPGATPSRPGQARFHFLGAKGCFNFPLTFLCVRMRVCMEGCARACTCRCWNWSHRHKWTRDHLSVSPCGVAGGTGWWGLHCPLPVAIPLWSQRTLWGPGGLGRDVEALLLSSRSVTAGPDSEAEGTGATVGLGVLQTRAESGFCLLLSVWEGQWIPTSLSHSICKMGQFSLTGFRR